jgi:cytidyltransferase-like protein
MKKILTKKNKKIVFTVGVFDFFHIGHLNFLKKAKAKGDFLIVAVQKNVKKYKPNVETIYTLKQRIQFLKSIKFVDKVIVYTDVDKIIKKVKFDIFAKGPDQNHKGFIEAVNYCKAKNIKVVTIPRTKNISSTKLRLLINNINL